MALISISNLTTPEQLTEIINTANVGDFFQIDNMDYETVAKAFYTFSAPFKYKNFEVACAAPGSELYAEFGPNILVITQKQ